MAWDAVGRAFYVGSLLRHKIVRIGPDGVVRDFVPAGVGGLGEVLGMKVDATRRELVAALAQDVGSAVLVVGLHNRP